MSTTSRAAPGVPEVAEVVALGRSHGLDAVGVAPAAPFATTRRHLERRRAAGLHGGMAFTYRRPERSCDPGLALAGARAIVVGARSYRRAEPQRGRAPEDGGRIHEATPPSPRDGEAAGTAAAGAVEAIDTAPAAEGRVARYAWSDHYGPLRVALGAVAQRLKAEGWKARVLVDDNALVDREAAYRAGLGWYGKNANLLLPGQGSWFVLGSVVTDAPLEPTPGPVDDGCGSCTRCLDGCPTGAIVAPGVVDARRCLAWLLQVDGPFPREHRVALGGRLYGCDDCQEVCPPNRRLARTAPAPEADASAELTVDLLALLDAPDDELLARHGRWYIPRREARYLRRNALVVLGNVARGDDAQVADAVGRALRSPDGIVRSHAVWTARRLGRDDLLSEDGLRLSDDPDPLVRAELSAAVERR